MVTTSRKGRGLLGLATREASMAKLSPKGKMKASPRALKKLQKGGSDVRHEWQQGWVPLLGDFDSPRDLAEYLGVSYQTLRRWGRAEEPDPVPLAKQKLIKMIAASKGLKPPTF